MILVKSKLSEALKKEGVSKNKPDKDFDAYELEIGTLIEMEHTKDKAAAKEIAKDHLCEQKDYYRDKLFAKEREDVIKKHGLKKSLNEPQKKAMKHSSKLGAGANKRKALKGQDKIAVVMKEFARGTLHSSSGEIVTDRKQALAIAYSEAGKKMKKSLLMKSEKDNPLDGIDPGNVENVKKYIIWKLNKKELQKSKKLDVGTVRDWKGKQYKKVAEGKWKRIYKGESKGKNISVGKLKSHIKQAKTHADLVKIIKDNFSRFQDNNGKIDPVIKAFVLQAKERKVELGGGYEKPKLEPKKDEPKKKISSDHIIVSILDANTYRVRFDYDPRIVEKIKNIEGRKWDSYGKYWTVPVSKKDELSKFIENDTKERAEREKKVVSEKIEIKGYWNGKIYGDEVNGYRIYVDSKEKSISKGQKKYLEGEGKSQKGEASKWSVFTVESAPPLNTPIKKGDKIIVYEKVGKPFRVSENDPSVFGSHLLGYEGEKGYRYYYREATDEEKGQYEKDKLKKSLYLRLNKADRAQHKYIKKVGNKYFYTDNEIKNFKLTKRADGFFYMDEQKVTNDPEKAKQFEEKVREHKPAGKTVGVGDKVQIKPTAKGSLGRGIVAKVKDISDGIARIVNETGKVFRVPTSSLIYAKSKNTLFNVVVRSPLELMKAKYLKREGTPGHYKYYYKNKSGKKEKQESVSTDTDKTLPQDVSKLDVDTVENLISQAVKIPLKTLRRNQDLVEKQQEKANEKKNYKALDRLDAMSRIYQAAVDIKEFKDSTAKDWAESIMESIQKQKE
jgi:hypothetical protein